MSPRTQVNLTSLLRRNGKDLGQALNDPEVSALLEAGSARVSAKGRRPPSLADGRLPLSAVTHGAPRRRDVARCGLRSPGTGATETQRRAVRRGPDVP